jgi:ATP-dependent exoDNAse (exonuclease V) beta subunit
VQRPPDLAERLAQLEAKGAPSFEDDARVRWSFLALRAEGAGSARAVEREPIDAAAVARESQSIASARASAAERMRRPLNSAASQQSHSALRDRAAEQHFEAAHGTASGGGLERKDAMAVGTAVHALLEDWDLDAGPVAELERQRARLPAALVAAGAGSSGGVGEAMLTEAGRILDSFASSPLFARFTGLADRLVARELPVWCAPELREAEEGSAAEVAPIFGVAGAIDLVYRDETGAFVVVDYKSDVVDDDAALEERCALYAPQGRVYVQALQQGLGLGAAPRFELWFLRAGRAVEVTL